MGEVEDLSHTVSVDEVIGIDQRRHLSQPTFVSGAVRSLR
jgi:hypothetical protein